MEMEEGPDTCQGTLAGSAPWEVSADGEGQGRDRL